MRPDSPAEAPGADRMTGSEHGVGYEINGDVRYIRLAILNSDSSPVHIRPGLASLTSDKCAAAFEGVSYVEGSGVRGFDEMQAQLNERWRKNRAKFNFLWDDSIYTELAARSREFVLPPSGFLSLVYDVHRIETNCAPLAFKLSGEPDFSLAVTFSESKH